jgi:hypothetical protein
MNCENCGQPLLADDTACWQCGHPVAGDQSSSADTPQLREKWSAESGEEATTRPVIIYGVITAIVICLALAVTLYLGRQPLVQAAVQLPPAGWSFISNIQRTFTTAIPETWSIYDQDEEDTAEDTFNTLLTANPLVMTVTAPLGPAMADTYAIFVGGLVDESGRLDADEFFVVARSNLLNDLTPDEMLALAGESEANLREGAYVENFDRTHLFLDVDIPLEEGTIRCRQQIIPGVAYAMIVSVCGRDHNQLAILLDNFQRLD